MPVYVAKPVPAPTPPDVPSGWNPAWEFPGSLPPGYVPEYSHVISGTSSIAYNGASSNTVTLYDHETYRTDSPTGSLITWTATVDGFSRNLRFQGAGGYMASVVSQYVDLGAGFYGAAGVFEFDLSSEDVGKSVILASLSTVNGYSVTGSHSIAITTGVKFYGHALRSIGTPVPDTFVQVAVKPSGFSAPTVLSTETDEDGYWEIEHALEDNCEYSYFAYYDGTDFPELGQDTFESGGYLPIEGDTEIDFNYTAVPTGKLELQVTCSENPTTLDSCFGEPGIKGDDDDARFAWSGSWSNNGGDGSWVLNVTDSNAGYVAFDYQAWRDNLDGQTLDLYTWIRGDVGEQVGLEVAFTLYVDGVFSAIYETTQATQQTQDGGDYTTSETNDWLQFSATGVTEL